MRTLVATVLGVAFTAAAIASPAGAHPWGGHLRDDCGGEAPAVVVCTTGLHFRFADEPTLRHGLSGISEYTGTAVSRLIYVGGERTFACDFEDGSTVQGSCVGSGQFPPPQTYFVQVCESYNQGTATRGGSGTWGCFMEHG